MYNSLKKDLRYNNQIYWWNLWTWSNWAEFTVAAIDVFALDKNVRIASIDVNFHLYCCYKFHRYSSIIDCWGSYKSHVVGYFTPAGFSLTIRVRRNMYRFYYWIWYKNGPQWIEFRSIYSEQFYYNLS